MYARQVQFAETRHQGVCLPIVEAAIHLLRVGDVASLTGSEWHDLTLLRRRRREKMARVVTVWQAKSLAP
jgi:hypothetical protein